MNTPLVIRRELKFASFADLTAECHSLEQTGYYKAGKWSLGQMCQHLSAVMQQSLTGFQDEPSWWVKLSSPAIRFLYLNKILDNQMLKIKGKASKTTLPTNDADDSAGILLLEKNIALITNEDATFHPSPILGKLTPEQWRKFHLWHCTHHLSYIVPPHNRRMSLSNAS